MNREKLFTFLWSGLLAFLLSLGAVGCVASAFYMDVNMAVVALWCAIGAIGSSICFSLPLGLLPISLFSLISGLIWRRGNLGTSLESLLYRISRQYNRGYKWGIIHLNHLTAQEMEPLLWIGLCAIGVLIAMAIAWSVCRRKTALPGTLLGILLLGSCMVVTDTIPDAPWLFFLFFGVIMLLLTQTVRRQDGSRGNRLSGVLVFPVLFLLLIAFVLIPENTYDGEEWPRQVMDEMKKNERVARFFGESVEVGTTGSSVDSGTVNLRSVGIRLPSQAEVMSVLTDYDDTLYLRGRALDRYDGETWSDSGTSTAQLYWPTEDSLGEDGVIMITTRYAHRMLYLPYYVQSKDLTDMTRGMENTVKLSQYTFTCQVSDPQNPTYQAARTATDVGMDVVPYIHLDEEVRAWAVPLAQEITAGETTVYGKANAICNYVRNSALYDTNTRRMPSDHPDFAQWFLEESETGYCVHFATATTVLLQAAGIPARYTTGYMVNVEAAYVEIVQAKDAHAWAEYWLPGYGWTVLESTPPDLRGQTPATQPGGQSEQNPTEAPEATSDGWRPGTARPSGNDQNQSTQTDTQKPQVSREPKIGWLTPVLILVGTLGLIVTQWRLRLHRRQKKRSHGNPNSRALACWQEVARCHSRLPDAPEKSVYALAEKARFSNHTLTEDEVAQLEEALSQAREKLAQKPIWKRLWDRLILALY